MFSELPAGSDETHCLFEDHGGVTARRSGKLWCLRGDRVMQRVCLRGNDGELGVKSCLLNALLWLHCGVRSCSYKSDVTGVPSPLKPKSPNSLYCTVLYCTVMLDRPNADADGRWTNQRGEFQG